MKYLNKYGNEIDVIAIEEGRVFVNPNSKVLTVKLFSSERMGEIIFLSSGLRKRNGEYRITDKDKIVRSAKKAIARWQSPDVNVMIKIPLHVTFVKTCEEIAEGFKETNLHKTIKKIVSRIKAK